MLKAYLYTSTGRQEMGWYRWNNGYECNYPSKNNQHTLGGSSARTTVKLHPRHFLHRSAMLKPPLKKTCPFSAAKCTKNALADDKCATKSALVFRMVKHAT